MYFLFICVSICFVNICAVSVDEIELVDSEIEALTRLQKVTKAVSGSCQITPEDTLEWCTDDEFTNQRVENGIICSFLQASPKRSIRKVCNDGKWEKHYIQITKTIGKRKKRSHKECEGWGWWEECKKVNHIPYFTICATRQVFATPSGQTSMVPSLQIPRARDYEDGSLSVFPIKECGIFEFWIYRICTMHGRRLTQSGDRLGGTKGGSRYRISYMATDRKQSSALCNINVIIKVITCDIPSKPLYGDVECPDGTLFGHECTYSCARGYRASYTKAKCLNTGQWDHSGINCSAISCPRSVPQLSHGQYTCSSYEYSSLCFPTCNAGYTLSASYPFRCDETSKWVTTGTSTCKDNIPPKLTNCPTNIKVNADRGTTSAVVSWSLPTARDEQDGKTHAPEQGQNTLIRGTRVEAGNIHTITYIAYDDERNPSTKCSFTVQVTVLTCPRLTGPSYGAIACNNSFIYGSTCTFSCNKGYASNGTTSFTCGQNKQWSSTPGLTCSKIRCPPPTSHAITHGEYSCPSTVEYQTVCRASCDSGFKLKQFSSIMCDVDTNNKPIYTKSSTPVCTDIESPKFENCTGYKEIKFTSDKGKTTSASVNWTIPTATDNVDSNPDVRHISGPNKGDVVKADKLEYVVYQAFDVSNNPSDVCTYVLKGKVLECDPLVPPIGGHIECSNDYIYGSVCSLTCSEGFEIAKNETSECLQDQTWSNTLTCKVKQCEKPLPVLNGDFNCPDGLYKYNTVCQLVCTEGFEATSSTFIKCDSTKVWTGISFARCKDILPPVIHGCVELQSFEADSGLVYASPNWTVPTAVDNYDTNVTITKISGPYIGDTIDGDSIVKYQATDISGNPSKVCVIVLEVKVLMCTNPVWIDHGKYSCDHGNIYGSVCTYSCNEGYELSTSGVLMDTLSIECQRNETWSHENNLPSCRPKKCGELETRSDGTFICTSSEHRYQTVCHLFCNEGFSTKAINTATCNSSGHWLYSRNEQCADSMSPLVLNCISYQTFYVDRGSNTANCSWTLPTAKDNVDLPSDIKIEQLNKPPMEHILGVGERVVEYRATDTAGNPSQTVCSITINVEELSCQSPYQTFNDPDLMFDCNAYTYGQQCNISCTTRKSLTTNSPTSINCEKLDGHSNHVNWKTDSLHQPRCEVAEVCPKTLETPLNGALVYTNEGQPLVFITCNANYDIPYGSEKTIYCLAEGTWRPSTVPDCIAMRPGLITIPVEYKYSGDCNSPDVIEALKQATLKRLQQFFANMQTATAAPACITDSSCSFEDLKVNCDDSSGRKRRELSGNIIIQFKLTLYGISSSYEDLVSNEATLKNLSNFLANDVHSGQFDIAGYSLVNETFKVEQYASTSCKEPGTMLDGITCKNCGQGRFLDVDDGTGICKDCPVGYYSSNETTTLCAKCKDSFSTRQKGARSVEMCQEMCLPGYVSDTGLKPCTPCPLGYFQPDLGMKSCIICPAERSTFKLASTQCAKYDIVMTTTETVFPFVELDQFDQKLNLLFWMFTSDNTTLSIETVKLGITTKLFTALFDSALEQYESIPEVSLGNGFHDRWSLMSITIDVNISVRLGDDYFNSWQNLMDDESATMQMTIKGFSEMRITGLKVSNSSINITDMFNPSNTCLIDNGNPVFNSDDIILQDNPNVHKEPSSCYGSLSCVDNPCGTHKCITTSNGYKCICEAGFSGVNCEHTPDYCQENECLNDATCINQPSNYTCKCRHGFSGYMCENSPVNGNWSNWSDWSKCSKTCDGGTKQMSRLCNSPAPGQHGLDCAGSANDTQTCNTDSCLSLNPCLSNPCTAHSCLETLAGYECKCNFGFMGQHCEIQQDHCSSNPCNNNGTCTTHNDSFICQCGSMFTGKFCETEIHTTYYWTAWTDCPVTCNGGTSMRTSICISSHPSTCVQKSETRTCNEEPCLVNNCASSPCGNNSCITTITGYECTCSTGFTGPACGQSIDYCVENECKHGLCITNKDGYDCICEDGFSGQFCSIPPVDGMWSFWNEWSECDKSCGTGQRNRQRECDSPKPQTGGKQCDGQAIETETCSNDCPGEYCAARPCGEDHTCVSHSAGYTCHCYFGYSGFNCQIPPEYCNPNPCENGGSCRSFNRTFQCTCAAGFTGEACQVDPVPSSWTIWSEWDSCTTTCGGGFKQRNRVCDVGSESRACVGNDTETLRCNDDECLVCSVLPEKYGVIQNCTHSNESVVCIMNCKPGYFLTNGTETFEIYKCGPETSFQWDQTVDVPSCDEGKIPSSVTVPSIITIHPTPTCDKTTNLEKAYKRSMNSNACNRASNCKVEVILPGCKRRRKRELEDNSTMIVSFTLDMENVQVNGENLIQTIGQYKSIVDDSISSMEVETSDVEVDGVRFVTNVTGLIADPVMKCKPGYRFSDGVCVGCAPGSMYSNGLDFCVSCPRGRYQDLSAQFNCKDCPIGNTTVVPGAWSISHCSYTCGKGFMLDADLQDCLECPVGSYQDRPGQVTCIQCPDGYSTRGIGSSNQASCVFIQTKQIDNAEDNNVVASAVGGSIGAVVVIIITVLVAKLVISRQRKSVFVDANGLTDIKPCQVVQEHTKHGV